MPAPASTAEFVELGCKAGLLEKARAAAYFAKHATDFATPKELASAMVQEGLLTSFQAQQLLLGRWHGFILSKKYRLLECLGSGGMGSVYLCEHLRMQRLVAIKILPAAQARDAANLERFYREARAVAALNHPNIVRAHDIDQDKDLHYLVMEYVEGNSLQAIIKKHGPMDAVRAAHYIAQAAAGLQHAHQSGLVHRDIKPANLLLERSGTLKVLDLGLARFFHEGNDQLTRKHDAGSVLGTADYLSPEQALDSHGVDIRADIYSLGATFYYLLAGHAPFHDKTVPQKLVCHQMRQPPPITVLRNAAAAGLAAVLERMMAKKPEERYQEPKDVVEALLPWTARPIPAPPDAEMPRQRGRRPAAKTSAAERATLPDITESPTAITKPSSDTPRTDATRADRPRVDGPNSSALGGPQSATSPTMITTSASTPSDPSATVVTSSAELFAPFVVETPSDSLISEDSVFFAQFTARSASSRKLARPRSRRWLIALAALVLVVGVGLGGWLIKDQFFYVADPPVNGAPPDNSVKPAVDIAKLDYRAGSSPFGQVLRSITGLSAPVTAVALAPDGQKLIVATTDRTPRLYDTKTGKLENMIGHSKAVHAIAFAPGGETALTASADKSLCLWDIKYSAGVMQSKMTGPTKALNCVAYVPFSNQAVSGGDDNLIHVWDLGQGKVIRTGTGHAQPVLAIAAAPDGRRVLSGSADATARLWDLAQPKEVQQWKDHTGSVTAVAFAPESRLAATGGEDGLIVLRDSDQNKKLQVFKGHTGAVGTVLFSADGRYLLSAGADGSVRIWDVASGQEVHRLAQQTQSIAGLTLARDGETLAYGGPDYAAQVVMAPPYLHSSTPALRHTFADHKSPVECVAYSPDGKLAASVGHDRHIRIWDMAALKALRAIPPGHADLVFSLTFSPDGKRLLSAGKDKTARVWNVADGKQVQIYQGVDSVLHQALFAPTGPRVLTAGADGIPRIWDLVKGKAEVIHQLTGHTKGVWDVAWSPDGKQIASVSADKTIRLWDSAGMQLQQVDTPAFEPKKVLFAPKGNLLFTDGDQNRAYVWQLKTEEKPTAQPLIAHQAPVTALALSRDGRLALTGAKNGELILWDFVKLRPLLALGGHKGMVKDVSISPDNRQALSASDDGNVRLWELPAFVATVIPGQLSVFGAHPQEVDQLSVAPDGKTVATAGQDGLVRVWDVATGKELHKLSGHTRPALSVRFSPDGKWLVSGGADATARLWNLETGKEVHVFTGHTGAVNAAVFSPDGKWLLTASADHTACLWDLFTGNKSQTLTGHDGAVTDAAFLPDGEHALTGSTDKSLRLWHLQSGKQIHILASHTAPVRSLAVSPDGKQAVSGGEDKMVCLWELTPGKIADKAVHKFLGHTKTVTSVVFSADGLRVLSGGADNSVRLWDAVKRQPLHTFTAPAAVTGVAFTPAGLHALSCGQGRMVRVWTLPVQWPGQMVWK